MKIISIVLMFFIIVVFAMAVKELKRRGDIIVGVFILLAMLYIQIVLSIL